MLANHCVYAPRVKPPHIYRVVHPETAHRSIRRNRVLAVLGALTAVLVVQAGQPAPASAASAKAYAWTEPMSGKSLASTARACALDAKGLQLTATARSGSRTKTLTSRKVTTSGWFCIDVRPGSVLKAPGKVTWAVKVKKGSKVLSQATGSGKVVKSKPVGWVLVPQAALPAKSVVRVAVTSLGQAVRLQRQVQVKGKATWKDVSTKRMPADGAVRNVNLKVGKQVGKQKLRVWSGGSVFATGKSLGSGSTYTTDTTKYGKYIAQARGYIKAYCPNTPVHVRKAPKENWAGLAWRRGGYDGNTAWMDTWIELQPGLKGQELREVALHECAHIVQYRNEVGTRFTGHDAYVKKIAKVYGSKPAAAEQQADCMAAAIMGTTRYGYYTKSCSGKRATEAKALWSRLGKKHQSARPTWKLP